MTQGKKNEPFYIKKEFKDLQIKWYKKLDSTGFHDIERSGRHKQVFFDEYSGFLHRSSVSKLGQKIDSFVFTYYNILRKFSHYRGDLANLDSQLAEITLKSDKKPKKSDKTTKKARRNSTTPPTPPTKKTKLSTSDRCILRMIGNGSTINEVSKHLRRYYATWVDAATKRGRPGTPYSVYYVHSRLDKLSKLALYWHNNIESLNNEAEAVR